MKSTPAHPFALSALALAVASTLPAQSQAQPGGVPAVAEGSARGTIEEIVVVAEFQQSLINRIPIAPEELPFTLNVLDRDFLDTRNFTRPIEALTTLPNITRTEDRLGTGTANFLSRGFEAPILVDNRAQNGFRGSGARDDAFVERYEVLKGPASISLGPIGAGGVINTVTKTPEDEAFVDLEMRGDQFGSLGAEVDANFGTVADSAVALRISGAYREFAYDADEAERETLAIRPVITADLGQATSLRASAAYTEHTVNPNFGFPLLSNGRIPDEIDTDTFTGFANGGGKAEDLLVEGEINHEFLDSLRLTLRGSHQETDFDYDNTSGLYNYNYADGGPGIGLNDPYVYAYGGGGETESVETFFDAQLAFDAQLWGQEQNLVVGVAYNEGSFDRLFSDFSFQGPFRLDELDVPRLAPADIGPLSPFTIFDQELTSAFAEAALRPADWLTIVGGVRYDELEQETVNFRRGRSFESTFDEDEVTFRVGATAALTDGLSAYVSFAQAFTPQFGVRRTSGPVGPEISNGWEAGVKGAAADGLLSFEAGYFYTLREDVAVRDPNNTIDEAFVVTVGELRAQGVELSGRLRPAAGLSLDVNLGLTDIDITEPGADEVTAAVFPNATGSIYLSYRMPRGPLEGLTVGGGFRYVGERDGPVTDFNSYTVADVSVSYEFREGLAVSLDVLNVGDEKYLENTASFAQNLTGGSVLGPPLTTVLTLRARF
ncbi:MAG: TonB-dependent siderophore receptor [Pseudomonadota bacterium]